MSKSQEMMELVAGYYCEPNAVKAGEMFIKLQAIADSLDECDHLFVIYSKFVEPYKLTFSGICSKCGYIP